MADEFDFLDLDPDEVFKKLYEIYEKMDDTGYVENPLQMAKFANAVKVFEILAKEFQAELEVPEIRPKDRDGSVAMTFDYFYADRKLYDAFKKALEVADSLEISPTLDGTARMSISVPDIFIHQEDIPKDS